MCVLDLLVVAMPFSNDLTALAEDVIDEHGDFRPESRFGEAKRIRPTCIRGNLWFEALKPIQSIGDRIGVLTIEEQPGWPLAILGRHDISRSTVAKGNHRCPAGLRFHQSDTKVFLRCEHERSGTLHKIDQRLLPKHTPKFDVWCPSRGCVDSTGVGPIAHDNKTSIALPGEAFDDDLGALVGDEPACEQKEVFLFAVRNEAIYVDWRMDNSCLTSVGPPDPSRDVARVSYEVVHLMGGRDIPAPQTRE
jgi:hypothetical protein